MAAIAGLVAGAIGGRAVGGDETTAVRPTTPRPPALLGSSVVISTKYQAHRGDHFMTGTNGVVWTTGTGEVRITGVRGLDADGFALRHLMLVERSDRNPGFQGPNVAGGLQSQVDAQAGPGRVTLRPAKGAVLRCCGTSYHLYLDTQITSAAPAGSLLGVRLTYETPDGHRGRVDVVMPVAYCTGEPKEPDCRRTADRVETALHEANR